jgi:hypothetical protein
MSLSYDMIKDQQETSYDDLKQGDYTCYGCKEVAGLKEVIGKLQTLLEASAKEVEGLKSKVAERTSFDDLLAKVSKLEGSLLVKRKKGGKKLKSAKVSDKVCLSQASVLGAAGPIGTELADMEGASRAEETAGTGSAVVEGVSWADVLRTGTAGEARAEASVDVSVATNTSSDEDSDGDSVTGTVIDVSSDADEWSQVSRDKRRRNVNKVIIVGDSNVARIRNQARLKAAVAQGKVKFISLPGATVEEVKGKMPGILEQEGTGKVKVILHVGTNDVRKVSSVEFLSKFERLVSSIKEVRNSVVVSVCPVPGRLDIGKQVFYRAKDINEELPGMCKRLGVGFINLENVWGKYYLSKDKVHYSVGGALTVATELSKSVVHFLG